MLSLKPFSHEFVKVHIIWKASKIGIHYSSSYNNQCFIRFSQAILHMGPEAKGKALLNTGQVIRKICYVMALFT